MEKSRKPKIRFKEFTDDWEQRKLGELVQFSKGNGYSKKDLEEVGTPIILYGRLYTNYETVISDVDTYVCAKSGSVYSRGGEVIVPASGETSEDISLASVVEKPGFLLGGDLNIITPPIQLDSVFLAISISNGKPHNDMSKMAQGKSVVHLHNSDLEKIELLFPEHDEQARISSCIRGIDYLITLHQRKLEKLMNVKKSMLEKMFPKQGSTVPEIRFNGFTQAWEQRKLKDLVDRVVRKNTNCESTLPLTISAQYGLVDQITYFNNRVASRDVTNYYLVLHGEFAYNKSTSDGYPFGAIKRLDMYEKGVLSTLYIVFVPKDKYRVNSDFLTIFFDTNRWHKGVAERAAEGARNHGLLNITADDFFDIDLLVPKEIGEQAKIGEFVQKLDSLITLHQRKLEKLKNIKKSMLEKMFI